MSKEKADCDCDGNLGCAAVILALCLGMSTCSVSQHFIYKLDAETAAIQAATSKPEQK